MMWPWSSSAALPSPRGQCPDPRRERTLTNAEPGVLHTALRSEGTDVWVDTRGEVDLSTSAKLERAITDGLAAGPARIYVDMSLISFIDSVGLAVLVRCHRLADREGCQLIVHSPTRQVDRAITLAGLDQYLRIET
jgi:anti-anti-sigma factor